MQKQLDFEDHPLLLREYDFTHDPPKLVQHLYDKMNSPEGIAALKDGDQWMRSKHRVRVRLVAEYNHELIASLQLEGCLGPNPNDHFTLYSVVTAPQFRGKGISAILFNFAKEWVSQYDARILLVDTWANNLPARKFYEKLGFTQYGCLPQGLINRQGEGYVDAIYYYLNLAP